MPRAGFNLRPEQVQGQANVFSGSAVLGMQGIVSNGNWVGTRFFIGGSAGFSFSDENTRLYPLWKF